MIKTKCKMRLFPFLIRRFADICVDFIKKTKQTAMREKNKNCDVVSNLIP